MPTTVETMLAQMPMLQYDPTQMQRTGLQMLSDYYEGGLNFVDPTNPLVALIEVASVMTTGFMSKNEVNTRRQYPTVSQSPEDLYRHMSDKDYIGRFALPSKTRMTLLISEEEILNKLVTDPVIGNQKLVFPRNTFFTVASTVFSLQYPIVISKEQHGGMNIVYDTDKPTPLQDLETNVVEWGVVSDGVNRLIKMTVDVQQFSIESRSDKISSSKTYETTIGFTDQFYYARVYATINGAWEEIQTTHSDQVYDPTVVTAVLKVVDKSVSVTIPQVYTTNQLIGKSIRIDVYQTRGPLEMMLSEYGEDMFSVTWKNYDSLDDTIFTAPVRNIRQYHIFSESVVTGGRNALTFEQLRQRVMKNATGASRKLPISNVQLDTSLEDMGYNIVRDIDNITNRVLLATKPMPVPVDEKLITSANAAIETVNFAMDQLRQLDTVINNGSSVTITPNTLYRQVDGVTAPMSTSEVNELLALPTERRALAVTESNCRFTPFYYVLDTSGAEFDVRAYHLDAPEALSKTFVDENASTLLQVASRNYGVFKTATGYLIQIVTYSSDAFRSLPDDEVHVQLSFTPAGEKDRAYLNGELVGFTEDGERIYNFDLSSNMNVDSNNSLFLSKFLMYTTEPRLTGAALTAEFDIFYAVSSYMGAQWKPNVIDQQLGSFLLPDRIAGVAQERLTVKFGSSLKTMWTRGRSYVSGSSYQTHELDVPMLYERDVYELGADGSAVQFDAQGMMYMNKLHEQGAPVLDALGNPVMKFKKGDVVLDANNQPVSNGGRNIVRQVDVFLVEGSYWFATDVTTAEYRSDMVSKLVSWLTNDLGQISKVLLENTRIYFYPKTTMGMIDVLVGDDLVRTIRAEQSINVTLQVPEPVFKNDTLRKQLTDMTIKVVNEHLSRMTISMSDMNADLKRQYGADVIDSQVSGLGGAFNLPSLTVIDNANRCSLRKRLTAQPDDTLITLPDVVVSYVRMKKTN